MNPENRRRVDEYRAFLLSHCRTAAYADYGGIAIERHRAAPPEAYWSDDDLLAQLDNA
ncbi:hypothetical protein [Cupriavidus nantongensis]|uniref:hypothetical protein n=1 Tax=Cupriavidus nantongensis TaxID=1796606 RepID=UPI000B1E6288|nr:hypothetical protein [Cupriavidus nantongensis]